MILPRLKRQSASVEELDGLDWEAGVSFRAYGLRIGIRTNDRRVLDLLAQRLPFGWEPARSPLVDRLYSLVLPTGASHGTTGASHLMYIDSDRLAPEGGIGGLLDLLELNLQLYVAEMASDWVFVHAGVVGWRGQAILIPGRSYSGKTTLVAELVRAGATYYSDEYAVLDRSGQVHPFARPLAIRGDVDSRAENHPVEMMGGRTGSEPLPAGLVIVSTYREGIRWRPRRITAGQGILHLLDNSVPARRRPETVLAALHAAVAGAVVLKGSRGEARETAPRVLAKLVC
ncbi:MAG: hypothetical protein JOZ41_01365 [Chloroflexi bacterium]|nr:hypothetical protein [Chloroflexota bacterium]